MSLLPFSGLPGTGAWALPARAGPVPAGQPAKSNGGGDERLVGRARFSAFGGSQPGAMPQCIASTLHVLT